jgi:hypothetical protein
MHHLPGKNYLQRKSGLPPSPALFHRPVALMQFSQEDIIASQEVQVERKHYFIEVRENPRGRFLKIVEEAHGHRNSVIVPSTGVDEFVAAIHTALDQAQRSLPA